VGDFVLFGCAVVVWGAVLEIRYHYIAKVGLDLLFLTVSWPL
jgi:hypothetical protein